MPFNLVFFKTDHLGTPRVITDQDGKVLSTHDYLAYGEELTDPEFTTNNMKFTGHERDPETGLDYMLARYYTSGSGRFLQVDPVDIALDFNNAKTKKEKQKIGKLLENPMIWNKYAYCYGNPINNTDPDGEFGLPEVCVVAAFIAIAATAYFASLAHKVHKHYGSAMKKAKYINAASKLLEQYGKAKVNLTEKQVSKLETIVQSRDMEAFKAARSAYIDLAQTLGTSMGGPLPSNIMGLVATAIDQVKEALKSSDLSDEEKAQKEKELKDLEMIQLDLMIKRVASASQYERSNE